MTSTAVSSFISTVIQHFPPFRWDEAQEQAWVDTMVRELAGFSDEVLDKARTTMVRTRTDRKIPLPAECIAACLEARRFLDGEKAAAALPVDPPEVEDWKKRQEFADVLVKSPLGLQAAREKWIGSLHNFAIKHRRLPINPAEITACKRNSKEFWEDTYPRVLRSASGRAEAPAAMPLSQTQMRWQNFAEIGTTMAKRFEEKRVMVLKHFGERV